MAYRDLKCENILLDANFNVKLSGKDCLSLIVSKHNLSPGRETTAKPPLYCSHVCSFANIAIITRLCSLIAISYKK